MTYPARATALDVQRSTLPLHDTALDQLITIADGALQGALTEAEGMLFLSAAPALLRELRARRAAMDAIGAITCLENVTFLERGPAADNPGDAA